MTEGSHKYFTPKIKPTKKGAHRKWKCKTKNEIVVAKQGKTAAANGCHYL